MKKVSKTVFAVYLLTLLWLVLFKFSYDLFGVLLDHQTRSLNLIPFWGSEGSMREVIDNLIVFVPFGLLLGVIFKETDFWRKLALIFAFSFIAETLQFIFAIGTTDITDLIMNTLGGLVGLVLYNLGSKYIHDKKLDWFIVVTGAVLLILLLYFRIFVLKVRY